jgi:hypothetical protein
MCVPHRNNTARLAAMPQGGGSLGGIEADVHGISVSRKFRRGSIFVMRKMGIRRVLMDIHTQV